MDLREQVALIAGGTGGLGRAVTLAFLAAGADVTVTYVVEREFADLQAGAPKTARLAGHKVDVTDEKSVRDMVDAIVAKSGRLDILVNTVGGFAGGKKLWEEDLGVMDRMLALNLRSGYVLARVAVQAMLRHGRGSIINLASRAALVHEAGLGSYSASKAAALALMESLAADLAGTGVRVNSVLPSIIDTEANRRAMPKADFSKWPKPEEIARVILFLASDDAKLIHGAAVPVYGGG